MSVNLINNPNGLAATFDLGEDFINPFGKIIIPREDPILQFVPIADSLLSVRKSFQRIDLTHTKNGTALTLNLAGFVKMGQPDFQWDDNKRGTIQSLIDTFFESAKGIQPVDIDGIARNYTAMDHFEVDDNDADAETLLKTVKSVLDPMAEAHGGGYEIADLDVYDVSELSEKPEYISDNKEPVGVVVSVFGACAGCGNFHETYGHAPEIITKKLDEIESPFQILNIAESETLKGGMVFKRNPQ